MAAEAPLMAISAERRTFFKRMEMAAAFVGRSVVLEVAVQGRSVLGLATEQDLAVNINANLAIDEASDLVISGGKIWFGVDATETVRASGTAADTSEPAKQ